MLPMKGQRVTTSMKGSSDKVKSSEDVQLLQNKLRSRYQNTIEIFNDDHENGESAREAVKDPDFDEYQDIEGKNKDDSSKTKSIKESLHANQLADWFVQVKREQQRNCPESQSISVRAMGRA